MIRKNIPNAITCGNLLCGCLAIIKTFEGDLVWASYLVGIAVVLDFFDGFVARLLKVSSSIGKDLDSLADMVTFGIVPAFILFKLIDVSYVLDILDRRAEAGTNHVGDLWVNFNGNNLIKYTGLVIAIFSAVRLAKFNNDTRQSDSFIGVPTPANAIFICGFPLIFDQLGLDFSELSQVLEKGAQFRASGNITGMVSVYILTSPWLMAGAALVLSFLLVAELPLLALKFRNFSWADNKIRFIFLILAVALLSGFQLTGLPLVIVLYILLSIVNNIFLKTEV